MFSKRSLVSLFILIFLVGLTSWYSVISSEDQRPDLSKTKVIPTSIVQNATLTQMSDTGQPAYIIHIKKGWQYNNDTAKFIQADITYYTATSPIPWTGSGEIGMYNRKTSTLALTQHVQLERKKTAKLLPLRFTTSQLNINLDTKVVTSNHMVTFIEPGTLNKTTAIGMIMNNSKHTLTLLHHVKSIYDTQKYQVG